MSPERWQQLQQLFDTAVDLPPDQRAAYLDSACAGNTRLRQQVDALLASHQQAGGFIEGAIGGAARRAADVGAVSMVGRRVGRYRLVRELGHGGMGTVYLAERADEQYETQVAIKLVRGGLHSREMLSRFRSERQILANLNHSNVARLLDGGTTAEGAPYVVMEYVDGEPIDEYCDRHQLSTVERLTLFGAVCSAVQYAHRNLVVHRDLKPGNILVTADRVPKLLDFGIAKLLDSSQSPNSLINTATGLRMMTPTYASPEQVQGKPITVASDVYSLGVVLYELLTGHLPYRFSNMGPLEIQRVICEAEPTKPSTAVTQDVEVDGDGTTEHLTPAAVSRARRSAPDRLKRQLAGDLDNIVLMALRKEPERRYESVDKLAEDVRRHLVGLPVSARKDTWAYRSSKFVQRHRVGVGVAALFFMLLAGFTITMTVQAGRIARERDTAAHVSEFLVGLFEVADPSESRGNTVTAREILDAGADRITTELAGQPEVQATLMSVMGRVYESLGLYETATPLVERALANRRQVFSGDRPEVAASLEQLGGLAYENGKLDSAVLLHSQALDMRRRLYGRDHMTAASSMSSLAHALRARGDYDDAERVAREAVQMYRRLADPTDPTEYSSLADGLNNLAQVLHFRGDAAGAEPLFREALGIRRGVHGTTHPAVGEALHNLATVLHEQGRYADAEAFYRESLDIDRRLHGDNHPDVAAGLVNLGRLFHEQGRYGPADSALRQSLRLVRAVHGDAHWTVGYGLTQLAGTVLAAGDLPQAEALYREAIDNYRESLSDGNAYNVAPLLGLGVVLQRRGRPAAAEPHLAQAVSVARSALSEGHWLIANAESVLGACLAELGRYDEAETLLVDSHRTLVSALGRGDGRTRRSLERVIQFYEARGLQERAEQYRASAETGS